MTILATFAVAALFAALVAAYAVVLCRLDGATRADAPESRATAPRSRETGATVLGRGGSPGRAAKREIPAFPRTPNDSGAGD